MPQIVQFTHPGSEHGPDKINGEQKSWNTGNHKRKFILCNGQFVQNDELQSGNLMFWGEWEPPSSVTKFKNTPNSSYPKWLHKPYLPKTIPISVSGQTNFQNTDPFVFGDSFKYFVCKQSKSLPKSDVRKTTALAKLEKGSIILFGSTKEESFFQLDTVFVVSHYVEYNSSDPNALIGIEGIENYREIVFKMVFPIPDEHSLKLRLYFGATYENPVEGMYSFSPSKLWNNDEIGFPRIQLQNINHLTNNVNANPKITTISEEEISEFWTKLRKISRDQGCIEGVKFYLP